MIHLRIPHFTGDGDCRKLLSHVLVTSQLKNPQSIFCIMSISFSCPYVYIYVIVVDVRKEKKKKNGLMHSFCAHKSWAPRLYHSVQALPLVERGVTFERSMCEHYWKI